MRLSNRSITDQDMQKTDLKQFLTILGTAMRAIVRQFYQANQDSTTRALNELEAIFFHVCWCAHFPSALRMEIVL